jgi:hypothetical protein
MRMKASVILCGAATVLLVVGFIGGQPVNDVLYRQFSAPSRLAVWRHLTTPLAAAQPRAPGHPGGGGSRPPGAGGSRPPGGAPGHPPGGSPGHPPGSSPGHPPGGSPGHPPAWHGRPPGHYPGYHPGVRGGIYIAGWPWWYWWPYAGPVYTMPPPPPQSYWYYCPTYGAYYPDVLSCPEPWMLVPEG